MSNALKGLISGFVATLVLSAVMILNGSIGLMPQIDIIQLLTKLGTLTLASAWMDHFIVGVLVWGLLFAALDATTARPALWIKGMIFGAFAWLMMMIAFMPLAGAGAFGSKLGNSALLALLILHLVYGAVLGATYGLLGNLAPVRVPLILAKEDVIAAGPNAFTMDSSDINDHVSSSSPSGTAVLIAFGSLAAFFALLVLAMGFRTTLGF
jgi:hypothetical protein